MTKVTALAAAAVALPLLAATTAKDLAAAQDAPIPVEGIRADPGAHLNQVRTVEGIVDRFVNRQGADNPSYYLEDDYGHQILIIPLEAPPSRGARVTVTGVITLDPAGDPVLSEFDADGIDRGDTAGAAGAAGGTGPAAGGPGGPSGPAAGDRAFGGTPSTRSGSRVPGLWVVGGLVLVLAVVAVLYRRGRAVRATAPVVTAMASRDDDDDDVDLATAALWPETSQQFEGRTMRFVRPDSTARFLSAKLEVIGGGDAGEEIPFVSVESEPVAMMFGRSPGEGPSHVQLKQKTVSRTHAIIRFRHDEWLLENLSMTNPTVLNDEVLGVKERLLTDGDRIEMGEVTFRFRSW